MGTNVKIKILLIEDDINECNAFAKHIKTREDVELIGTTNSSSEGINYLKNYKVDAVILDIELQHGKGSGIEFIEELNNMKLNYIPMIVVISNNLGSRVYNFLHSHRIEYIFYKGEEDYSQEKVINTIISLTPYCNNTKPTIVKMGSETIDLKDEYETIVSNKINKVLDDLRSCKKIIR